VATSESDNPVYRGHDDLRGISRMGTLATCDLLSTANLENRAPWHALRTRNVPHLTDYVQEMKRTILRNSTSIRYKSQETPDMIIPLCDLRSILALRVHRFGASALYDQAPSARPSSGFDSCRSGCRFVLNAA
jgi:hypothetical protein